MMKSTARRSRHRNRRGTALVEVAVTLPVFFTFIFGIVEYGRLQMVNNMLQAACRTGARYGSTENVSTDQAKQRVSNILAAAFDSTFANIAIKDAGVFDTDGPYPTTASEYDSLSNLELNDAEPRQLFLVRATVNYNDVALIPFSVLDGVELSGQSLMRHE